MSATPGRLSLLLPAYLNGTLGADEHRWVDEQLAASAEARAELAELRTLQGGLRAHWDAEPAPSSSARSRVMAAISSGESARTAVRSPQAPGFGARLSDWLSALFAPRWMPAAALALMVLQLGLIVALANLRPLAGTGPGGVIPRGGGLGPPETRLKLVLQGDARQSDVTTLLRDLRAHIVAGPDAEGAYTVAVPTTNADRVNEKLVLARSRSDVVTSIAVVPGAPAAP